MECLTKRLQFAIGEVAEGSARNRSQLKRSDSRPNQFDDRIADLIEHLADDSVAPFVDHDTNDRSIFCIANRTDHFRQSALAVDGDSASKAVKDLRWGVTVEECFVLLVDPVAWMHDAVGDLAIVRQQQQSLGLAIETAYRNDTLVDGHEVHDGVSAALVRHRRDVTTRLVEQNVASAHSRDQLAVDFDLLRTGIYFATEFSDDFAVDSDASFENQFLGAPS